ncbi:MAG: transposase [Bdellovibrionales bacterium]
MLRLLAEGTTRADVLAQAVTTNIKRKGEIKKSLTNCFTVNHIFLIDELMQQYDDLTARVLEVDRKLAVDVTPYAHLIQELRKIPGIDMTLAVGIIAEATNDVSNFADERKFAAWAGVAAGNNESAGKKRSRCRDGSPHFRKLLIQAAHGAKLKRGSFYRAKYNKWKFSRGSANKAKVAVANRIARAIYKIIAGDKYKELGDMRGDPKEHKIKLLIKQLKNLGVDIQHHNHQVIASVRKVNVDISGITLN